MVGRKNIKIELFTVDRCVVLQMLLYVILIEVFRWNFFDFSDGLGHVSCGENRFQPTIDKMGSAGQAHWLPEKCSLDLESVFPLGKCVERDTWYLWKSLALL